MKLKTKIKSLMKFSFFIHLLSAMLISTSVFGVLLVESFLRKSQGNEALTLHKLSQSFSRFASFGGVFALLTGIYNWVSIGEVGRWLVVKIILFVWFVVSGVVAGRLYFSKRGEVLNKENFVADEVLKFNRAIWNYSVINAVVFVLIVFLAVFKPF